MSDSEYIDVKTSEELRALLGEPSERAATKVRATLHDMDRRWIGLSPFCMVATADAEGRCDVSPKGDPPGFVKVLDERRLAIPERPGNRRADSFHNISSNPHVGLIFVIPGRTDTLRVNGRARILRAAPFFAELEVRGHRPKLALLVEVEEVYYHCAKAFMRSGLWESSGWQPEAMPSRPEVVMAIEDTDKTLEELEDYYGPQYAAGLYASD